MPAKFIALLKGNIVELFNNEKHKPKSENDRRIGKIKSFPGNAKNTCGVVSWIKNKNITIDITTEGVESLLVNFVSANI